jgi:hypothetical protein
VILLTVGCERSMNWRKQGFSLTEDFFAGNSSDEADQYAAARVKPEMMLTASEHLQLGR